MPDAVGDAMPDAVGDAMPDAEDDAMPDAEAGAVIAVGDAMPDAEADAVPDRDDRIALLEAEVRSLQRKLSLWRPKVRKFPYWLIPVPKRSPGFPSCSNPRESKCGLRWA